MQGQTAPAGGPAKQPSSIAAVSANCVARSARALRSAPSLTQSLVRNKAGRGAELFSVGRQSGSIIINSNTLIRATDRKLQMPGTSIVAAVEPWGGVSAVDLSQCWVGGCRQLYAGLPPGSRRAGINRRTNKADSGGTHDSCRAGFSIRRRIIRALVRCYFCVLVC